MKRKINDYFNINEIKEYIDLSIVGWTLSTIRKDTSYELISKIVENNVYIYKNYADEDYFVFGITLLENNSYRVNFFLDTEREIIEALNKVPNIKYNSRKFDLKEFVIELSVFNEVKEFLQENVWKYDFGYLY